MIELDLPHAFTAQRAPLTTVPAHEGDGRHVRVDLRLPDPALAGFPRSVGALRMTAQDAERLARELLRAALAANYRAAEIAVQVDHLDPTLTACRRRA